jgi:hypothetical protein
VKTLRETILKHSWQEDMVGPHLVRVDDAIDALRQWLAYEGLVVVPRLPSWEMLEAGHVSLVVDPWDATSAPWVGAAWECMIAAAPDALETKP